MKTYNYHNSNFLVTINLKLKNFLMQKFYVKDALFNQKFQRRITEKSISVFRG